MIGAFFVFKMTDSSKKIKKQEEAFSGRGGPMHELSESDSSQLEQTAGLRNHIQALRR